MRASFPAVALVTLLGVAGCSEANKQNYALAALGTGTAIVAVGINRAITKDCWALCSPGYTCNQESGLCEPGECNPPCEYGFHCVRSVAGDLHCDPDARVMAPSRAPPSPASSGLPPGPWLLDAGITFDAGPGVDAGPTLDAGQASDAGPVSDGGS